MRGDRPRRQRMTEATGFEARTIHRLLEVDPKGGGFKRGEDNPPRLRPACCSTKPQW